MFGLGMPELILILVISLVIFGPSKLPEMGASIGKAIREFRNATNGSSEMALNRPATSSVEKESEPIK
jgi:sec-independent protein translocase protein TatA